MAAIGVSPATPRQRLALAISGLLAVVALVMIGQLNGVLAGMRTDGGVAGSVADLTVSVLPGHMPAATTVSQVVGSWKAYETTVIQSDPQLGYAGPRATSAAVLRLDSLLLVPAYALFGLCLMWWARSWSEPESGQPAARAIVALARSPALPAMLAVAVVADELENLSVSRLIGQAWDGNALDSMAAVQITGLLKWVGLILVAAPFVVIAIRTLASVLWPCVRTAWFPMALLVLLALAADTDQAADVVRRWGPGQTIWTMLAVALFSVTVGLAGARAFQIGRLPIVVRAQGRPLSIASVGRAAVRILPLAVLTVVALIVAKAMDWRGVAVLAALLGGVYLLSLPLQQFWEAEQTVNVPAVQTAPAPLRQRLGTVLAAAVPLLVGVAVLRAATADVFYKLSSGGWLEREHLMLLLGVALVVIGTILAAVCSSRLIHWTSQGGRVRRYGLLLGLAVVVVLPAALLTLRSTTLVVSQGFGSVAIVLVFLTVLVLVASGLLVLGDVASRTSWARDAVLPPPARLLGFQRPPMVGLLVVWIALASLLGPAGYHDVRLLRRAEVAVDVKTLTTEFNNWRSRQPDSGSPTAGEPLLVVAASGGGLRAAYWTAAVLDCILERNPDPVTRDPCGRAAPPETIQKRRARLFALSGVSGGGFGLITYDAHTEVDGPAAPEAWYDRRLRDDFFAPTLGWWLFRDTTAAVLRPGSGGDRATALERAWERPWRRDGDALTEGFLTVQSKPDAPLILLSAYSVEDGCRLNAAVIHTSGGREVDQCGSLDPTLAQNTRLNATTDVLDFLCDRTDLRRSTAALLGARFPWISPSGRLLACDPSEGAPRTFAVDGGYRDNSAASSITEMWPDLEGLLTTANRAGCVVPYFVQIDSESVLPEPGPYSHPSEALVPVKGLTELPTGNAEAARVAALRTFSGPLDPSGTTATLNGKALDTRWVRVAPGAHLGSSAPLSWVLSDAARKDLRAQLALQAGPIQQVRSLIDAPAGALRCSAPGRP